MYSTLLIDRNNQVLTVWLNRPEAKNAFNPQMIEDLIHLNNDLATNPELRVIIFRGKDKQFCSGADINWMKAAGELSAEQNSQESTRISDLLESFKNLPQPTIALAEGGVYGGAIGILAVCDWVLSTPECRFGFPEVHLGIIPAVIWPYVLMKINPKKALQKALTGQKFNSQEAVAVGLVDQLTDSPDYNDLNLLINQLLIPSPEAQKEIKRLTYFIQQKPDEGVIMETIKILSNLKNSKNGQEGLKAFIEKRKPEWT